MEVQTIPRDHLPENYKIFKKFLASETFVVGIKYPIYIYIDYLDAIEKRRRPTYFLRMTFPPISAGPGTNEAAHHSMISVGKVCCQILANDPLRADNPGDLLTTLTNP